MTTNATMPGDLKYVTAGHYVSAREWNKLVDLVRRALKIRGPNTIQGLSGAYIIGGGGRGGGAKDNKCVLRTLDAGGMVATAQKVEWDVDATKLDGEEKFPHHMAATGPIFDVTPLVGGTYDQFNIQYAVRDVDEADDPENLANAPLWWYNAKKEMWLFFNWPENIQMKDPNAEEVGGGGV